jgi:DNA ligase (NAD+)
MGHDLFYCAGVDIILFIFFLSIKGVTMRRLLFLLLTIQLPCFAVPQSVERQADHLRTILRQADEAYHNKHQSLMSDAAYDALREQYDRWVGKYPGLLSTSPVGTPLPESGKRIAHSRPVLSLAKAYSGEAIETFIEKCGTHQLFCIEPKIDGLTIVLRYHNGILTQAITRGDGKTGMDVTTAVFASGAVPVNLHNAPAQLEVRGEVLITTPAFTALNRRRVKSGQTPLKSPRNTAAGTLRLKDYAEIANRKISIRIFELIIADPMPATHSEALVLLAALGLPTVESRTVAASDVHSAIADMNQRRSDFPFQTDGIVIQVDDRTVFNELGATAHHPRGALARKYKEIPIETRLLNVTWSIGETGKLTPIAHFEPVDIQGATLAKASLYNLTHLRALDLKIGDWVQVIRAGGSIPEIIGICPGRRTGSETSIPNPPNTDI